MEYWTLFSDFGLMACFLTLAYYLYKAVNIIFENIEKQTLYRDEKLKMRMALLEEIKKEEKINTDNIVLSPKKSQKQRIKEEIFENI